MNWNKKLRKERKAPPQRRWSSCEPTPVNGISEIPFDATCAESFRLTMEVEKVNERETKSGEPCYFLNCRDEEGESFSIVVWESQWPRLQEELEGGSKATLDVKVPKVGSSFTLA